MFKNTGRYLLSLRVLLFFLSCTIACLLYALVATAVAPEARGALTAALVCSILTWIGLLRVAGQPVYTEPAHTLPMTKTIHHLLRSLDVQRNIMRRCFDHAPFGVLLLGRNHQLVYSNPAFLQMSQRTREELNLCPAADVHRLFETSAPAHEALDFLLQDGQALPIDPMLSQLCQKQGGRLPTLLSGFPLTDVDAQSPEGYILFVRDLTPTFQLQTLHEQFSFLLHSLTFGVVVTDLDLRVTYVNHAFTKALGCSPADLLGQPLATTLCERDACELSLSFGVAQRALQTDEEQQIEWTLPDADERTRHMQITAMPIKDLTGTSIGLLLLYQDRTQEKELLETVRRHDQLETVSQMAASIAHEVRNPMTSVQGFLQLMSQEVPDTHAHAMYLRVMEEDLKRISEIITEYLNFSRMGSDAREEMWIGTLLHNTYTLLLSEANLKGIQLELAMNEQDLQVTANANRLKQVLINLARNALDAMASGGTLTLGLQLTDAAVHISVRDTGSGIPAQELPHIFSPFYTTKKTGTGLGLYISKQIIEEHGGTLRVQSELGRGTTFSIEMPRVPIRTDS